MIREYKVYSCICLSSTVVWEAVMPGHRVHLVNIMTSQDRVTHQHVWWVYNSYTYCTNTDTLMHLSVPDLCLNLYLNILHSTWTMGFQRRFSDNLQKFVKWLLKSLEAWFSFFFGHIKRKRFVQWTLVNIIDLEGLKSLQGPYLTFLGILLFFRVLATPARDGRL